MKIIMKIKKQHALLLLLFVFLGHAADQEYCKNLSGLTQSNNIQKILLDWVDLNFSNSNILKSDVTTRYTRKKLPNIRPGKYTYLKQNFNWDILKFDKHNSRINLIGLEVLDFYEDYNTSKVKNKTSKELRKPANSSDIDSIFFSEKPYYGILIKLKTSDKFIDEEEKKYINIISERVAVYCRDNIKRSN